MQIWYIVSKVLGHLLLTPPILLLLFGFFLVAYWRPWHHQCCQVLQARVINLMYTQLSRTVKAITSQYLTYRKTNTRANHQPDLTDAVIVCCVCLWFLKAKQGIFRRVFIIFLSYKNNKTNTHILTLQKKVFSLKKLFVHPFHIKSKCSSEYIPEVYFKKQQNCSP